MDHHAQTNRYGRRRRVPWWAYLGGVIVAAWLSVALFAIGRAVTQRGVDAGVRSFLTGPRSVQVTFEVDKDPGATAVCTVRARNRAGQEVGRAQVTVGPATQRRTTLSYLLRTTDRPISGEVLDCRITG